MDNMTPAKRILFESLIRLAKGFATALEAYVKACDKNAN